MKRQGNKRETIKEERKRDYQESRKKKSLERQKSDAQKNGRVHNSNPCSPVGWKSQSHKVSQAAQVATD
jgi:hypothetical protein